VFGVEAQSSLEVQPEGFFPSWVASSEPPSMSAWS
jgi:hypothetical protein